jgi:hypothetical protein
MPSRFVVAPPTQGRWRLLALGGAGCNRPRRESVEAALSTLFNYRLNPSLLTKLRPQNIRHGKKLLVAQGFDRIHMRSTNCRVDTKTDAGDHSDSKSQWNGPRHDLGG